MYKICIEAYDEMCTAVTTLLVDWRDKPSDGNLREFISMACALCRRAFLVIITKKLHETASEQSKGTVVGGWIQTTSLA